MKKSIHIKSGTDIRATDSVLLAEVGERSFCMGVFNESSGEIVELAYYEGEVEEDSVVRLIEEQRLRQREFPAAFITYRSPKSILVPDELYKFEESAALMDVSHGPDAMHAQVSEELIDWKVYNVYRVSRGIHELLQSNFSSARFIHHYTLILKTLPPLSGQALLVDFRADEFCLVATRNKELLLAQTFTYATPEDVLYYILKVCQQLHFSQQEVNLVLSGWIDRDSAVTAELLKFFLHVNFEDVPGGVKLDDAFSDYPPHYFSSMCKLALCVS